MNSKAYEPKIKQDGNQRRIFQVILGLAITSMGLAFLLHHTGLIDLPVNWWALYLFLPAVGFMFTAYHIYRRNGNRLALAMLIPGLLALAMGALAVSLLFGYYPPINWNAIWPVFIILVGLSMLFGRQGG